MLLTIFYCDGIFGCYICARVFLDLTFPWCPRPLSTGAGGPDSGKIRPPRPVEHNARLVPGAVRQYDALVEALRTDNGWLDYRLQAVWDALIDQHAQTT
jgi:hypothetical protein